jgi:hypothetical protein
MEQKTIPTEKNYNLSKVKLNPNGGLQADYQVTETVGGEPSITDYHANVSRDIHPDLRGLFEDLRPIVARVFNITSFLTLLETDEMKLPASKMLSARAFAQELIAKIDVRGVSWSGSDDNVGVIITSVFETPNGLKTCINTPRIKLAQVSFGFEEELEKIVEAIKTEVYQFLFNGKQAQLSLFGEQAPAGESGTAANDAPADDMPEM